MFMRLNNIRYMYIRSHLYGFVLNTFLLLAILLSVYVWFRPEWLNAQAVFLFMSTYVFIGFIMSVYAGFHSSTGIKQRMDRLSMLIKQLSRGDFSARVEEDPQDEMTGLTEDLNELGEKLQQQKDSLVKLADERAELAKSAHKAATIEERQRLARDLHDAVSQQLFALTMMAQATEKVFDKKPDKARSQLHEITQMALQAQTEMRALLLHLRPVYLSGDSLSEGVHSLIEELKQKCSLQFFVEIENHLDLSDTSEEHVFRVLQEALSNILRHANASTVHVKMSVVDDKVFVHIGDDGVGFQAEDKQTNKASYGLKTMRERCEEIGGDFSIRSREGEGTHIDMRVPKLKEDIG